MRRSSELIFLSVAMALAIIAACFKEVPTLFGINLCVLVGILCSLIALAIRLFSHNQVAVTAPNGTSNANTHADSNTAANKYFNGTPKKLVIYYGLLTVLTLAFVIFIAVFGIKDANDLTESRKLALPLTAFLIAFVGGFARNIKRNSYLGLRMPWLYTSDKRWQAAHHCLADISLPLVVLYVLVALVTPINYFATISIMTIIIWMAIPSVYPLIKGIA